MTHEHDDTLAAWLSGRIPSEWFSVPPVMRFDREEILIVGSLADVDLGPGASPEALEAARAGRIKQHREDTRAARMRIAAEAERRFRRKVSWGAACAGQTELFTTLSLPVMTRLRMQERQILDTLVDSGVARSRSHALAWCVKLVAANQADWIGELQAALGHVEKAREAGPELG